MVEKLFPDPFLKNQNLVYLWINSFLQFIFAVCLFKGNLNIVKPNCRPFAFTLYKAILKIKKRSGTSFPDSFSA